MEPVTINRSNIWYRFATRNLPVRFFQFVLRADFDEPKSTCELFGAVLLGIFVSVFFYLAVPAYIVGGVAWADRLIFDGALGVLGFMRSETLQGDLSFWVMWLFSGWMLFGLTLAIPIFGIVLLAFFAMIAGPGVAIMLMFSTMDQSIIGDVARDWWNKICRPIKIEG